MVCFLHRKRAIIDVLNNGKYAKDVPVIYVAYLVSEFVCSSVRTSNTSAVYVRLAGLSVYHNLPLILLSAAYFRSNQFV